MAAWINMGGGDNAIKVEEDAATVLDRLTQAAADGVYCKLTLLGQQESRKLGPVFVNPSVVHFVRDLH